MNNIGPGTAVLIPSYATIQEVEVWKNSIDPDFITERNHGLESYGAVWYMDIEAGLLPVYHAEAHKTNEMLARIPGLFERLTSIAEHLEGPNGETGLPVRTRGQNWGGYWANYGIVRKPMDPIRKGAQTSRDRGGVAHSDLEGLSPYPHLMFDLGARAYSAVLCLELGASGGGLRFWPRRRVAGERGAKPNEKYQDLTYQIGSLAVFDSYCFHQILPSIFNSDPACRRRAIAGIHFLYRDTPECGPHFEVWF